MTTLIRWVSTALFVSALVAMAALVISDVLNHLEPTAIHRNAAAWSLICIGASYAGLQFNSRRPWSERFKAILLGTAFLLWGSEQFLPVNPWVTAMDSTVILIFVVDLSLLIVGRLQHTNRE